LRADKPNAQDGLQAVVDRLDLAAALTLGSKRNDLLPPRHEDQVGGELGKRFSEGLKNRIARGRYEPLPASIVVVPKPGNTTRPAALLSLSDRVVYAALVETLRERIENRLIGRGVVLWPRGTDSEKRWPDFEKAPLENGWKYIAIADITSFYELIQHEVLGEQLVDLTGKRAEVAALIDFLNRVMGGTRGLPQGLDASDPLATAYLSSIDSTMVRSGVDYRRHGDDVRIGTDSYGSAREALHDFERGLRVLGLVMNSAKSVIMKAKSYTKQLDETQRAITETRELLLAKALERLSSPDDSDALQALMKRAEREDLVWDFFYHERISFEEVVRELRPLLEPSEGQVASVVFTEAMKRTPGKRSGLPRDAFHHRIASSLVRLAAARSPDAIEACPELVTRFPEKVEMVANYLKAMPPKHAKKVVAACRASLGPRFRTGWESAWLLRVQLQFSIACSAADDRVAKSLATSEETEPIARVEAVKLLAKRGKLDHAVLRRLWDVLPRTYRADLVVAAFHSRPFSSSAESFLAGSLDDPINEVVIRHLEADSRAGKHRPKRAGRGPSKVKAPIRTGRDEVPF
jgi:hypothetical protein